MAGNHAEVSVNELRSYCDPSVFHFESTNDVSPLTGTVGQDRGVNSLMFGLNIKTQGFNLFVAGPTGTGRNSTVDAFVNEKAKSEPVPDDIGYVNNFGEPDKPNCITLPPGVGCSFVKDMEYLVEQAKQEIPRAFEGENYEKRRNDILNAVQEQRTAMIEDLQKRAEEMGLAIEMTNVGVVTIPVQHGKPISREEFDKLPQAQKNDIQRASTSLQDLIQQVMVKARKLEKDANQQIDSLDKEIALFAVGHLFDDLRSRYGQYDEMNDYLNAVQNDMMDNLDDFKDKEKPKMAIPGLEELQVEPSFDRYKVNLIVNNEKQEGSPVVMENNPTYYNLIGRVDFKARLGALTTDFSMVKAGALHKANGGYLVLDALDVLTNPMSWDALKRTLRSGEVRIENIAEHYGLMPTSTLKPEAVPIDVKVILIGSPTIYYLLHAFDEDFRKLFKVKADFDIEMSRNEEHVQKYATFIAARVKDCNLKPFDPTGVARIVDYGSWLIQDKDKLSTRFIDISDIVSESSYWASQNGHQFVNGQDVDKAIDEKKYRSNLIEEKIQELIEKGIIMIDTSGEKVGQVNGLSVYSLGDYNFGRPSRITARTYIGKAGVTNIERETRMSGPIHYKGVLTLAGYLGAKYAEDKPLPLTASLAFEQNYEGVEGDSASSTELYAILSSLADVPIDQEIAVTGSVNQLGEVQPIGGVTWKVEGYYEVCKAKGLTGKQGVMIPYTNVQHLLLKDEVVQAVADGKFHIWPVKTIDEGIQVLTGVPAGEKDANGNYPEGTIHARANAKLRGFANIIKEFGTEGAEGEEEEDEGDVRIAAARKVSGYALKRRGKQIRRSR